jgi:phosphoribosyl 1,2-cyclic phosphodiesterase
MNRVVTATDQIEWLAQVIQQLQNNTSHRQLLSETDPTRLQQGLQQAISPASSLNGATTCIEITSPNETVIFDAGGGIVELARDLETRLTQGTLAPEVHLCFSHLHIDHLFGLPLCRLFYDPRLSITLWVTPTDKLVWDELMSSNSRLSSLVIPTTLSQLVAIKEIRMLPTQSSWQLGSLMMRTQTLNHPGGSRGYRIERNGVSVVLATDHELSMQLDTDWVEFIRDADLYYADAQYGLAEYLGQVGIGDQSPTSRVGWGHSSLESVIEHAVAGNVGQIHLGHHDPWRPMSDFPRLKSLAKEYLQSHSKQKMGQVSVSLAQAGKSVIFE